MTTYLSTREAADRLGVSLRSVQLWVESGALRAWKTAGGHRRIPLASVEQMLAARAANAGTAASPAAFDVLLIEDDPVQVELMRARLATLALPVPAASCDGALVAFGIRNVADLDHSLVEMRRVLRPGARFVILELSTPTAPLPMMAIDFGTAFMWIAWSLQMMRS